MPKHPFEYLAATAAKYGVEDVLVRDQCEALVDSYTRNDLADLAAVYREIERREDNLPLAEWVKDKSEDGLQSERRRAYLLFPIFYVLGRRGIAPFSSRRVQLTGVPKPLDWSKLPQELRYLAEPARKFGVYQFHDDIVEFLEGITETELTELRKVNNRIKQDHQKIKDWLDCHRITEHREAQLIYFMFGVLDSVELD
jgi:hypothetical protein